MQYATTVDPQHLHQQHTASHDRDLPTCEQPALDPVGNQARTAEAGLDGAGVEDLGLLGEMADFVLDTLPLALAVPVARAHAEEPAVQRWADGVPVVDALRWVQDSADSAVDAAWPAGTGLCGEAALGGEAGLGVDLLGTVELLHTADGRLRATTTGRGVAGLDGAGLSATVSDAFGQTVAGLGAGGSLKLLIDRTRTLEADFDVVELVSAGVLATTGALSGLLLGTGAGLAVGGPEGLVERWSDARWDVADEVAVATGAGASGRVEVGHSTELPADLVAEIPALRTLAAVARGVLQVGGAASVSFAQGPDGLTLCAQGGMSALASLATAVPALAELPGWAALDTAASAASEAVGLSLELGLAPSPDLGALVPDGRATVSLSRTLGDGVATATDTLSCSLAEAAEALSAATPDGLSTLLAAGGTAWQREVEVQITGDRLQALVPSVHGSLARLGLLPAIQADTVFRATGALSLDGGALGRLAGLGITAPEGWTGAAAVRAVGESVAALRAGEALPYAWLAPWAGALAEVAGSLHLDAPRLRGTVRVGAGGGVDLPGLGAEARGAGGVVVDQALADTERDAVEAELARRR